MYMINEQFFLKYNNQTFLRFVNQAEIASKER